MLRVLLVTAMPPPEHGGITNWTRVVRRELDARDDLELMFVNTTNRNRQIPGMQTVSRLLFGSCQGAASHLWRVPFFAGQSS